MKPGLLLTGHPSVFRSATHMPARFLVSPDKLRLTAAGFQVGKIHTQSWHATTSLESEWLGSRYTKKHAQYQLLGWKRIYEEMLNTNGGGLLASTLIAGGRPSDIRQSLSSHLACTTLEDIFDVLCAHLQLGDAFSDWPESAQDYFRCFRKVMEQRTMFMVERRGRMYFGIGPESLQADDVFVVLTGAETPFILRPVCCGYEVGTEGNGIGVGVGLEGEGFPKVVNYEVVRECYVHGLMKGEVFDLMLGEENSLLFELVEYGRAEIPS